MKNRPLCIMCIGLMIIIWIAKSAGLPIFGAPQLAKEITSFLAESQSACAVGIVTDRQVKENSVQYLLSNSRVQCLNHSFQIEKIKLTVQKNTGKTEQKKTDEDRFPLGTVLRVYGELQKISMPGNPGEFDAVSYYAGQGIYYEMYCRRAEPEKADDSYSGRLQGSAAVYFSFREGLIRLRENAAAMYQKSLGTRCAGVLSAMLLGDKSGLLDDVKRQYQTGGIIHILSISGLHISLIGMALFRFLRRIRCPEKAAALLAFFIMAGYTVFIGRPASADRALIMFGVLLAGGILRKSYDLFSALALAGILLLLRNPGALFQSGFQLSFSAVLGLGLLYPVLLSLLPASFWKKGSRSKRHLSVFFKAVFSWLAATLATLPLIARYFYEIPLLALPANLLILPLMSLVLCLGIAATAAGFLLPSFSVALFFPVRVFLYLFDLFTGFIARIPCSSFLCGEPEDLQIFLYYVLLAAVFWLLRHPDFFRREKKDVPEINTSGKDLPEAEKCGKRRMVISGHIFIMALFAAAFCCLFIRMPENFSVTMLDVGQGESIVLQRKSGIFGKKVFLLDGGSTSEKEVGKYRIIPYLKQQGIREIEGVFVTHGDADHCNGIEELLLAAADGSLQVRIKHLLMPEWMTEEAEGKKLADLGKKAGARVLGLQAGDRILSGKLTLSVLYPSAGDGTVNGNEGSLVLLAVYQDAFRMLFSGDLDAENEQKIIPSLTPVQCLKVAHHGSRTSTSRAILGQLSPDVCLISAPEDSPYGHPHKETLIRIREVNADVYVTGDSGAIRITVCGSRYSVETFRQDGVKPEAGRE